MFSGYGNHRGISLIIIVAKVLALILLLCLIQVREGNIREQLLLYDYLVLEGKSAPWAS